MIRMQKVAARRRVWSGCPSLLSEDDVDVEDRTSKSRRSAADRGWFCELSGDTVVVGWVSGTGDGSTGRWVAAHRWTASEGGRVGTVMSIQTQAPDDERQSISTKHRQRPTTCRRGMTPVIYDIDLTLWRPLLPYGCNYKASCARPS